MAADQKRKRVNGTSIIGYGSREQHRTKRKSLGLVQNDLHMRSHISVEWDGNQKTVVAKREQIGISWRQMKPFVEYVSKDHKVLADVFTVPHEIFVLDNLSEVLSYEVWKTHLSENERNLLMQFLPSGIEPHQALKELLTGVNFNFGNPFLKWGASLCPGELHPDTIVDREQQLKSDKRAYYSQLHNYHTDMIGFLSKLKERWQSCKDPEMEILQRMWRKKHVERRIPSNVNESRLSDHDGIVTMTSESCSSDAEVKACSSDNQISSLGKDDKLQRRLLEKSIVKDNSRNLMFYSDDMHFMGEKPKKVDKLPKCNIRLIDDDKYMSYIKISKQQHELVKSMKQSGKSVQSKSLNRVLGNLNNIHVQPYKVFVKEEQNKLHEHWLQLVSKDLPVVYTNWTQTLIQRHSMRNFLLEEIKEKCNPSLEEDDNGSSGNELHDQYEESMSLEGESKDQNDDNVSTGAELLGPNEDSMRSGSELQDLDEDNMSSEDELQNELEDGGLNDESNLKHDEDSFARASENQSSHNSYVSGDEDSKQLKEDSEKNIVLSESDDVSPNKEEYERNMNTQHVSVREGAPFTSGSDVWQTVEMPHSYYDSAATSNYTAIELSLPNSQVNEEQRTHVIDLETDLRQEETGKELFHRHLDESTFLNPLFKGEGLLSYHQEQKGAELDIHTSNNVMMADGQCSSHFKEPLQMPLTLDQGQRRPDEVYMPENIYSNAGGYLIPSQDPLAAVNATDWAANTASMAAPSQSHLNTANFIGRHWPPADHQVRGGWSGSDGSSVSSRSVGTVANSDQNLFSILSQCNQLHSGASYDSVRNTTDQFLGPRTNGGIDAAGTSRVNPVVPQASHPLDYFTGCETPSGLVPDDITWMNLPNQNSAALHDPMGKPYLRTWNR